MFCMIALRLQVTDWRRIEPVAPPTLQPIGKAMMIIDAGAPHPTLRQTQDPIFDSLRRWTKADVPTQELPVATTVAVDGRGRRRSDADQCLGRARKRDDLD
jgi:hypothetical protein